MRSVWQSVAAVMVFFSAAYAQSSPENAFDAYKSALQNGDKAAYLEVLTSGSEQVVNPQPALMQNEYRVIQGLRAEVEREGADKAVVYLFPADSQVPPYTLRKEGGRWKVDLKAMSERYVFDRDNKWHKK